MTPVSASLFTDKQLAWLVAIGALVVVGGGYLVYRKVAGAAAAVGQVVAENVQYVDPTDNRNLANQAHEWVWQNTVGKITGQTEGGVGIWLADVVSSWGSL